MNKEEELKFLKDRLEFRHKLFMEYAFADKRLIPDIEQYRKDTLEIEDKVMKLTKQ